MRSRALVVGALGLAQTLAWGSSYYLPAILAGPIGDGVGVPRSWVFGALSSALLIAAFAGPAVGRVVDRRGGRGVLVLSNIVLAAGLVALAAANGPVLLFAAWAVLGVGMALGLYDTAFAALSALYGRDARGPITGITLIAGFASTVSWPLTTLLNGLLGWRETLLVWAALNLVLGVAAQLAAALPGTDGADGAHARPLGRMEAVPGDVSPRFCFCGGLVRDWRDVGAPAAPARALRSFSVAGDRGGRLGRAGAGGGAAR